MLKIKFSVLFVLISLVSSYGQVGINTTTPNGALDVNSSTQGLIAPRVSLTASNIQLPVLNPAGGNLVNGTLVYNIATAGTAPNNVVPGYYYWNGSVWLQLGSGSGSATSDWSVNGNAGLTTASNFIGTTDNVDFVTKTNNTEQVRVTSTGNVGIGDNAPTTKLEVNGAATNSTATVSTTAIIDFTASNLGVTNSTASAITLAGIKDGGAYSLVTSDITTTTAVTFSATGFTFIYMGTKARTSGKEHIYSIICVGTKAYVTMAAQN